MPNNFSKQIWLPTLSELKQKQFAENWDRIFGKPREPICDVDKYGEPIPMSPAGQIEIIMQMLDPRDDDDNPLTPLITKETALKILGGKHCQNRTHGNSEWTYCVECGEENDSADKQTSGT